MIGVVATGGPYRAAVAELPLSAFHTATVAGAIAVVPGRSEWTDAVRAASEGGAVAVIVADPAPAPAATLRSLARDARIPVIVERPLLRTDVAADARDSREGMPPNVVVIDGAASAARLGALSRDAAGWARTLTGGTLTLVSVDRHLALLEGAGIAVAVSLVTGRRPGDGWLRAQALGAVVTEVEVEGRVVHVASSSARGRLVLPARYESAERVAVRRALAAVGDDEPPADLDDLLADTLLAEQLGARAHVAVA